MNDVSGRGRVQRLNKIKYLDGTGYSRYLEISDKEEMERVLETAPLMVGTGAVESDIWKVGCWRS